MTRLSEEELEAQPMVQALQHRIAHLESQLEGLETLRNANQINQQRVEDLKSELEESKTLLRAQQEQIRSAGAGTQSGAPVAALGVLIEIAWQDDQFEFLELTYRVNGQTIRAIVPKSTFVGEESETTEEASAGETEEAADVGEPTGESGEAIAEDEGLQVEDDSLVEETSDGESATELVEDDDNEAAENAEEAPELPAKPGSGVLVSLQSMQVVGPGNSMPLFGPISAVKRVINDGKSVEIEQGGAAIVVATGQFQDEIEAQDRVVLDPTSAIVVANLGRGEKDFFEPDESPVSFDDIGGLEEAKQAVREAIELPFRYPELYARFNKKPTRGVLLVGPPGCGKTLLVRAIVTELKRVKAELSDSAQTEAQKAQLDKMIDGLLYIKATELMDKFVGNSESNIRAMFEAGQGKIIAIDEADAVLRARGSGVSSDILDTMVPTFLAEMDGFLANSGIVFILSNRPDTLDQAVTRPGRCDKTIAVVRPDQATAQIIFDIHMRKMPITGMELAQVIESVSAEIYGEQFPMFKVDMMYHNGNREFVSFDFKDIMTGAMIENVAQGAAQLAINRIINSDNPGDPNAGVELEDVRQALKDTYSSQLALNQEFAIEQFAKDRGGRVAGIQTLSQVS